MPAAQTGGGGGEMKTGGDGGGEGGGEGGGATHVPVAVFSIRPVSHMVHTSLAGLHAAHPAQHGG